MRMDMDVCGRICCKLLVVFRRYRTALSMFKWTVVVVVGCSLVACMQQQQQQSKQVLYHNQRERERKR